MTENYPYILLTKGEDKSRNNLILSTKIKDYVDFDNDKDVLVSLWRYGEDAVTYFQKNGGTLKGFRGEMYSTGITFDLDSHGEPLEIAFSMAKELVKQLKEKDVEPSVYFSGRAGVHVTINSNYFGQFEPSSVLPAQMLALAKHLTDVNFDKSIYSHLRMFRLINTIHPKSGLYKIPIRYELLDYPDKVLELAKTQQPSIKYKQPEPHQDLIRLKETCFNLVPDDNPVYSFVEKKPKNKLCITHLLKGVKEGNRNDVMCRIVSHFKQEGLTPELAYDFIHSWNKQNKPPESSEVIKTTFKSIWEGGYTYGCYDFLLDEYCDKNCYLYSQKQSKVEQNINKDIIFYKFGEMEKIYENYINSNTGVNLGFSKKIDEEIVGGIDPADLVFIISRPGGYKSTIAQMIGTYFTVNYPGYFLYISLEMSLPRLFERQMQTITAKTAKEIRDNFKGININNNIKNNFLVCDKKGLTIEEIKKAVIEKEQQTGIKIEEIAIDFFHALRVEGKESKTKAENAMDLIKQAAYDLNTRIITLVHTSRAEGGDGFKTLGINAARDSAKIEDYGDFVITLNKIKEDDSILMVNLPKNKKGNTIDSGVRMKRAKDTIFLEEDNSLYLPVGE